MNIVELTNKVRKALWWNLLDDIGLDQNVENLLLTHILDLLITWKFKSLLLFLLLLFSLLLFTFLFFGASKEQSHILKFNIDHLINFWLKLFFKEWHDFLLGKFNIMSLLVVVSFISINPRFVVVIILLIKFLNNFRSSDFDNLRSSVLVLTLLTLLFFLFFLFSLFLLLAFFLLLSKSFSLFLLWT